MNLRRIRRPTDPEQLPPPAVRAGDFVFFAGGLAAHSSKGIPDEIRPTPNYPFHGSAVERQLRMIYTNMAEVLRHGGSSINRVMKIGSFHTKPTELDTALRMRRDVFGTEDPPASTAFFVPQVENPELSVTNDVIALASDVDTERVISHEQRDDTPLPMHDSIYSKPIFSQMARGGGLLFTSGLTAATLINKQFHLRPEFVDEMPYHQDFPYRHYAIKFQTRLILTYLRDILARVNADLGHVVKAEVILTDASHLAGLNEVWQQFFPDDPPARTIYFADVAPSHQCIEVEFIAIDPDGPYTKRRIQASDVARDRAGDPQAVKAGPYLFLSGVLATDQVNGVSPDASVDSAFPHHTSSAKLQAEFMLNQIERISEAGGTTADHIVRRRAMYQNLWDMGPAEDAWLDKLGSRIPPTTTFETNGPLHIPGCTIGYDIIAFSPDS